MRFVSATALALTGALCVAQLHAQQPPAQPPAGQPPAGGRAMNPADAARKVPGGGVLVSGWKGKVDAAEAGRGSVLNDSKFEGSGGNFTIASGPATIYYNPADAATS